VTVAGFTWNTVAWTFVAPSAIRSVRIPALPDLDSAMRPDAYAPTYVIELTSVPGIGSYTTIRLHPLTATTGRAIRRTLFSGSF